MKIDFEKEMEEDIALCASLTKRTIKELIVDAVSCELEPFRGDDGRVAMKQGTVIRSDGKHACVIISDGDMMGEPYVRIYDMEDEKFLKVPAENVDNFKS